MWAHPTSLLIPVSFVEDGGAPPSHLPLLLPSFPYSSSPLHHASTGVVRISLVDIVTYKLGARDDIV
jgi:hypothetical protein